MKKENLPKKIAVFPLSNFIIFPNTTVPLNIFEPRYIEMINDCMKSDKLLGMIQPKMHKLKSQNTPDLYKIGCLGKIIDLQKTDDNRYLIELKGLIRFDIISEINSKKSYRECDVSFDKFYDDLEKNVLEIDIVEKFVGERGRVNCSLRETNGFWRWLGIQYVISEK